MIPIEKLGRRPRRRHSSPVAAIRPVHRRRMVFADPSPVDGATRRQIWPISRASKATSMRSGNAAASSASAASSRSCQPIQPGQRASSPNAATRAARRLRQSSRLISTASISWRRTSRTRPQHHALCGAGARGELGQTGIGAAGHHFCFPGAQPFLPRSTRRWAASPPTAST